MGSPFLNKPFEPSPRALHGRRCVEPIRRHLWFLEGEADGDSPFEYVWSDPGMERAALVARHYLNRMDGPYVRELYDYAEVSGAFW